MPPPPNPVINVPITYTQRTASNVISTAKANAIDPEKDIGGSLKQTTNVTLSDEIRQLGPAIKTGSTAAILSNNNGLVLLYGIIGASTISKFSFLTISNAYYPVNNGTFRIEAINSGSSISIRNINAVPDPNNGFLVWTERQPYSLQRAKKPKGFRLLLTATRIQSSFHPYFIWMKNFEDRPWDESASKIT